MAAASNPAHPAHATKSPKCIYFKTAIRPPPQTNKIARFPRARSAFKVKLMAANLTSRPKKANCPPGSVAVTALE
jgi:hypothetical protein